MKKTILALSALLIFPGCDNFNKLLGTDKNDTHASAFPAPAPGNLHYPIYRDFGGSFNEDPQFQMVGDGLNASNGMELLEEYHTTEVESQNFTALHNGVVHAGEGTKWVRINTDTDGSGRWITTFDKNNVGRTVDLSGRNLIVFMIRVFNDERPVEPADQISLTVEDGAGHNAHVPLKNVQNFNPNSFDWQAVQVPVSAFAGLDLSKIKQPFGLTYGTLAQQTPLVLDFDDIWWE